MNQYTDVRVFCPFCDWVHVFKYDKRKRWDTRARARFGLRLHITSAHPTECGASEAWLQAEAQLPRAGEPSRQTGNTGKLTDSTQYCVECRCYHNGVTWPAPHSLVRSMG
jgi:hypothetical protein